MKIGFFTLLLLLWMPLMAANLITVEELNNGACWVKADEELRFVSFNDAKTFNMPMEEFIPLGRWLFNSIEFPDTGEIKDEMIQGFIHCGGYGSSIVYSVQGEKMNYCLWGRIDLEGKVTLEHSGVEPERPGGPCEGKVPGSLIIVITQGQDIDYVFGRLGDDYWSPKIRSIEIIAKNTLKIQLEIRYQNKIRILKNQLRVDLENFGISNIDYEPIYTPVGEYLSVSQ